MALCRWKGTLRKKKRNCPLRCSLSASPHCPSWISSRERMTIENISWSISTKECCLLWRRLNRRPPVSSRTVHPTDPPRQAMIDCFIYKKINIIGTLNNKLIIWTTPFIIILFTVRLTERFTKIRKILINPKYWDTLSSYPTCSNIWTSLLFCWYTNSAGWLTNSVDSDQMLCSTASDQGLHCLIRPFCPNTYGYYGRSSMNPADKLS